MGTDRLHLFSKTVLTLTLLSLLFIVTVLKQNTIVIRVGQGRLALVPTVSLTTRISGTKANSIVDSFTEGSRSVSKVSIMHNV